MKCRICGNDAGNEEHVVYEMMFGTSEPFTYFSCASCECMQIGEIPEDMERFYAGGYYSHTPVSHGLRAALERMRDQYALTGCGWPGHLLHSVFPNQALYSLRQLELTTEKRILDIGCGDGELLAKLDRCGMKHLYGIDPFARPREQGHVRVEARTIFETEGIFDLIMLHHSLEHMRDPLEVLRAVAQRLEPTGTCVVRVPVIPCHAWKVFKCNWVQLDAPRHFHIFSESGLHMMAEHAGLKIDTIKYDSTAFQFWGSVQYEAGVALLDDRSFFLRPARSMFSFRQILSYSKQAKVLNLEKKGDQAVFYLSRKDGSAVA